MFDSRNSDRWSVVLFVVLGVVWGASFVAIEIAVEHLPPLVLAGGRYAVAGLAVAVYAAFTTDRFLPRTVGDVGTILAAGVFTFAGYQGGLFLGEQYVSGSVAAVVVSLVPILTAAFAGVLLADEPTGSWDVVGYLLGIVGVTLVAGPSTGGESGRWLGVGLVLVGAVSFSLGGVVTRRFERSLSLAATQAWAMGLGCVALLAGSVARGESIPRLATVPPAAVVAFAYVAVVAGAGGYLVYFRLVERSGVTDTNLVSYLEPVIATLVTAALGHGVALTTVVGFGVVFAGFAVVERHSVRRILRVARARLPTPSPVE